MGNRGSFGRRDEYGAAGNPELVVDKILYTSYDVVKYVAENVVAIQNVNSKMDDVQETSTNIAIISAVATQIDKIFAIGSNIDTVISVDANMPKLKALFDELALLVNLNAALPQIVKINDKMTEILYLVNNMSKVENVAEILPDIIEVIDQKDTILAAVALSEDYAKSSQVFAQTASEQRIKAEQASTLAGQRANAADAAASASNTHSTNAGTAANRAETARTEAEAVRTQVTTIRDNLLSDITATAVGVPNGQAPKAVYNPSTKVIAFEIPAGASGAGTGDMLKSVYDPDGKNTSAFSMGNMSETASAKVMTGAERTKLNNIANNATANSTDAQLRDRSTHTGTQTIATVSGLQTALDTLTNTTEKSANKGVANGYAGLDANAKIPTGQLPESILGAMKYQGTWNASTNSPAIPAASNANNGHYRIVSTAGATLIDGVSDWQVGDWIVSNGTTWAKIDSSDQVNSVNGKQGTIVLTKADVNLDNADNTSDVNKPVSTAQQTALDKKLNLTGGILTGKVSFGSGNNGKYSELHSNGDLTLNRGDGTGYTIWNAANAHFGWDGANYIFGSAGGMTIAGDVIRLGSTGSKFYSNGDIKFTGSMLNYGAGLFAALQSLWSSKQDRPTVSADDPSGGKDGDVWYKV